MKIDNKNKPVKNKTILNNNQKNYSSYKNKGLICFSAHISQTYNESKQSWSKKVQMPIWKDCKIDNNLFNLEYNGLALVTGKKNNITVLDIDDVSKFKEFLKNNNQTEPDTVTAISGSGGIHYYFKYTDNPNIKNNSNSFGKDSKIDIRNDGGCIFVSPSRYYNYNVNKYVEYKWVKSIFTHELADFPQWLIDILENNNNTKYNDTKSNTSKKSITKITKTDNKRKKNTSNDEIIPDAINNKYDDIPFTYDDIEKISDLLSLDRISNYSTWFEIGVCLYNINPAYISIWKKISKKDKKGYQKGCCEEKWKSIDSNPDRDHKLSVGSLIYWAKLDSPELYKDLKHKIKINKLILAKYPNDKLHLGNTIKVNKQCHYTEINSTKCLIKGEPHYDFPNSMYIDITHNNMSIKCRHKECFGKIYPCEHIILNKNELNQVFYGDITIVNNYGSIDDEYVEFKKIDIYETEELNLLAYQGLDGKSESLAKIIYYFYNKNIIYTENKDWYVFENHRWINEGKQCSTLILLISESINRLYGELIEYYHKNMDKVNNYDLKMKKIDLLIKSCKDINLKNNILQELTHIYIRNNNKDKNFLKKLDANNNLIGFNNGIYDLQNLTFRDGKAEDNVSITVGYDYTDNYSKNYKDLLQFISDILPELNEREYFLTYLSTALYGNTLELFSILSGSGRNGKSKLIELIKLTFGNYYSSISSQLLTRPRPDANQPDPGLLSLSKKRIVIASEPEKNCKLNTGFLKFLTGRDTTMLRMCHSNNMINFTPMFITFLICNDIPNCDDMDNAFARRLRCIHFPTEFVDNPTKSYQKKINTTINENFMDWRSDFMLLLIEYYKKYIENNKKLVLTDKILKWTNKYKENTDIYLSYLNECTIEADTNIKGSDLYYHFKEWFKFNNPNSKIPSNKNFYLGIKKYKESKKMKINKQTQLGFKNLSIVEFNKDNNMNLVNYINNNYNNNGNIPLKTLLLACIKNTQLGYNYIKNYIKGNYKIIINDNIKFVENLNINTNISLGEKIIFDYLTKNNIKFTYQKYFSKCIDKTYLPFDFYIYNINTCIEYDGEQHFKPIQNFGGNEEFRIRQDHDNKKNIFCKLNNINLVRIKYNESKINIIHTLNNLIK